MSDCTPDRRSLLKGGATMLTAAATMSSEQLLGYAKAWAQEAPWKPEAGAKVNLLRWKRFVEAEGVGCRQHRAGAGHGLGPLLLAVPVPGQMHRHDRRRRLSRQEVRRLDAV